MPAHKGTKTIETDRLILRQFTMEDAEPMFRNWASDDEVTRHLTWPTHESVEITYRYAHLFPTVQKEMADKLNLEREA